MTLLGIHSISKSHGTQDLFENISFTISQGDRIGLLGPNGAGKSTLLKILLSLEPVDSGTLSRRQNVRIGYASQSPEFTSQTVEEVLLQNALNEDETDARTRARILLGKAQFTDFSQDASKLSGGWKKRLDIIRALMQEPDLLLLDEPTNHLDLEGIFWLEKLLLREKIAYMVVSHDRYFLNNVANKIIELNRCYPEGLFISEGNMESYKAAKEAFLSGQREQQRSLRSTVRDEIEWLRKSPKARTTKSRSRIEKAHALMDELADVTDRNKTVKVDIDFTASERETRKLLTGKNLTKSIGEKELFKGVDILLSPGTRLGIVGKNGTGKTTLLKILAGEIAQDMGTIKYADNLKLVYFDQHREHISPTITLREALSPNGDMVEYRGQLIHVNGWAKKFLFKPERLSLPVGYLSGGERARILIAKLMLQPADILFLDEPTNDLDIATLEVIEENLKEFLGAVVLISHDRCLMETICTQILGLGSENEPRFFADYRKWEEACRDAPAKKEPETKPVQAAPVATKPTKKLSYHEQRELNGMEQAIITQEALIASFEEKLLHTQSDPIKSLELYRLLGEAQGTLERMFERWEFLTTANKQ